MREKGPRVLSLITVGLIIYFAYVIVSQQQTISEKSDKLKECQAKIQEETTTNKQLKVEKENSRSDEFIEKIAREKLGMVKQNERVFVDIDK